MACHYTTEEALDHVLDSSDENESDFTDLTEGSSDDGNNNN